MKNSDEKIKELENHIKNLTDENNQLKAGKISIDLSNEDNRKTIKELIEENKILIDSNNKEFITSVQNTPPYMINKVIHKIYIKDIININIKRYYEDYSLIDRGKRKLVKTIIWCYHKGFVPFSTINNELLEYLLNNKLIDPKIIQYSDVDCSTGISYFLNNSDELKLKEVLKINSQYVKDYKTNKINENIEEHESIKVVDKKNELDFDDFDL